VVKVEGNGAVRRMFGKTVEPDDIVRQNHECINDI
jgi:hypothetical protein